MSTGRLPFRFGLRELLLVVAVLSVHLAVGRVDLWTMMLIAPVSLSVLSIEFFRRQPTLLVAKAVWCGMMVGALLYAVVLFTAVVLDILWRSPTESAARLGSWPEVFDLALRVVLSASCWYAFCGVVVSVGYALATAWQDSRSRERLRPLMRHRGRPPEPPPAPPPKPLPRIDVAWADEVADPRDEPPLSADD